MSAHDAPIKTPLGEEEMRRRSLAIGQRHRTVLFLVDGRRPLSEVLGLAHQAGALTSHFEELVRLGLVELPPGAAAPEPVETGPGALGVAKVSSFELNVPAEAEPPVAVAQALPTAAQVEPAPARLAEAGGSEPAAPMSALSDLPAPQAEAVLDADPVGAQAARVPAELPRAKRVAAQKPTPASQPEPKAKPAAASPPPLPVTRSALAGAGHALTLPGTGDETLLGQVRDLLIDALRLDAPFFGAEMLATARRAESADEMVELVWKIEKRLSRSPHSRNGLISLQRARELLDLGNTAVFDDGDR